jgi:hypothetical protein
VHLVVVQVGRTPDLVSPRALKLGREDLSHAGTRRVETNRHDLDGGLLQRSGRALNGGGHVRVGELYLVLEQTDAEGSGGRLRNGPLGEHLDRSHAVAERAGEDAGAVEAGREGGGAAERYPAVRGLQPHQLAARRRDADRAGDVRAQPEGGQTAGHGGRAPA